MKEQVVTSQDQQVTEKQRNKTRKWFRMAFIISVLSAFLSVSAFAEGESASISTVTASFTTLTDMISQVFSSIVGNPVLVVFLAAALLRVGIGLFRSLRRAAR